MRCNRALRTPWSDVVAGGWRRGAPSLDASFLCELAHDHGGDHVDYLDELAAEVHVWARWDDTGACRFVVMPPCGVVDHALDPVKREACHLTADHSSGHSWQVTDDTPSLD
ncbi:hypothetical protein [Streptomyces lichenis]|uniref:Uncharacterized protein n=1 Tax=Streptomyces lichenis TaxID=2306967 RepID=A0ABT0ICW2_9ACTN|nr:hypothetical protein [Streptomyces lichenis]MCK8679140.1 hypothetical protein [Streptomyces lichenis]